MLDLQKYSCLGAALRDALDRFAGETCLIEADRDREKTRLTYSDFKEIKDVEFHELRKAYVKAAKALKEYLGSD